MLCTFSIIKFDMTNYEPIMISEWPLKKEIMVIIKIGSMVLTSTFCRCFVIHADKGLVASSSDKNNKGQIIIYQQGGLQIWGITKSYPILMGVINPTLL